jgi:dolichol-phosphate mannosyltransferase
VVDDNSQDNTQQIAKGFDNVKVLARPKKMGISSAIVDGIKSQKADSYIIMDADLSHPPELLPKIRYCLNEYDLVVCSRYIDNGANKSPLHRRIISNGARLLSRPLTPITDRTTGFFGIRAKCLEGVQLNPIGMHFGIECFVKAHYDNYTEVSYWFPKRLEGKSKFNTMAYLNYLRELSRLYRHKIRHA